MDAPVDLLTIAEAAPLLGMSPTTLRDHVTAGKVPHLRLTGRRGVRFTRRHLEQILAAREIPVGVTFPVRARAATGGSSEDAGESTPGSGSVDLSRLAAFAGLRSLRAG